MNSRGATKPVKTSLRRVFWLPAALAGGFVIAALLALVTVSARAVDRMVPVQRHFAHIERLHLLSQRMDQTLVRALGDERRVAPETLVELRGALAQAAREAGQDYPQTRAELDGLGAEMATTRRPPAQVLTDAVSALNDILASERAIHNRLVDAVAEDARIELRLTVVLLVVLPLVAMLTLFLLRKRIKRPLDDLGRLLQALADQDYQPVPIATVEDSALLIQPVLRSYNHLVNRTSELESNHRALEQRLQDSVAQASRALLEQSRELARAEKLAAVGELSAAMAHEIRNPLAGIQLACTRLAKELPNSQQPRIEMVIAELRRLSALLRERVDEARHAPESCSRVAVAPLVDGLLSLVRYQIADAVSLHARISPALVCELPESGLRQALLNLVLNAAAALGQHPGNVTVFAETYSGGISVGVLDDGPGLPDAMVGGTVRPFVSGHVEGTGLGLAIVQRFVRGMSGELSLDNRPAGGACVTLRLPCRVHTPEPSPS